MLYSLLKQFSFSHRPGSGILRNACLSKKIEEDLFISYFLICHLRQVTDINTVKCTLLLHPHWLVGGFVYTQSCLLCKTDILN